MSPPPKWSSESLAALTRRVPSALSRHDGHLCCAAAIAWVGAMARVAPEPHAQPPGWISHRWRWGPSRWPLTWCEAVRAERLDCGALTELAVEASLVTGLPVVKIQLIQEWDRERLLEWQARWAAASVESSWIQAPFAYHELVGVLRGTSVMLWDPVDGLWKEGGQPGYGRVVAIRLLPGGRLPLSSHPGTLTWDGVRLRSGLWCERPDSTGLAANRPSPTSLST